MHIIVTLQLCIQWATLPSEELPPWGATSSTCPTVLLIWLVAYIADVKDEAVLQRFSNIRHISPTAGDQLQLRGRTEHFVHTEM